MTRADGGSESLSETFLLTNILAFDKRQLDGLISEVELVVLCQPS